MKLPPIQNTFTEAIAEVVFQFEQENTYHNFSVEIGKPIHDVVTASDNDWRCPVRTRYLSTNNISSTCGVNSYQALVLAINSARSEVASFLRQNTANLRLFNEKATASDIISHIGNPI